MGDFKHGNKWSYGLIMMNDERKILDCYSTNSSMNLTLPVLIHSEVWSFPDSVLWFALTHISIKIHKLSEGSPHPSQLTDITQNPVSLNKGLQLPFIDQRNRDQRVWLLIFHDCKHVERLLMASYTFLYTTSDDVLWMGIHLTRNFSHQVSSLDFFRGNPFTSSFQAYSGTSASSEL